MDLGLANDAAKANNALPRNGLPRMARKRLFTTTAVPRTQTYGADPNVQPVGPLAPLAAINSRGCSLNAKAAKRKVAASVVNSRAADGHRSSLSNGAGRQYGSCLGVIPGAMIVCGESGRTISVTTVRRTNT